MRFGIAITGLILLSLVGAAGAAEKLPPITGIYGDLAYEKPGGALFGTEITIRRDGRGYSASVRVAAGDFGPTVVVPVTIENDRFSFTVPEQSYGDGRYEGRILPSGMVGTRKKKEFGGPNFIAPLSLRRQSKPWPASERGTIAQPPPRRDPAPSVPGRIAVP